MSVFKEMEDDFFWDVLYNVNQKFMILKGKNMATLFIIGNGFDLAHGLSTSYFNLKQYISKKMLRFIGRLMNNFLLEIKIYGHRLNVM